MSKIDLKTVGKHVIKACELVLCGLVVTKAVESNEQVSVSNNFLPVTYGDAVKAIMDSDMWSHDKEYAIAALKRYETTDYYSAIVNIVSGTDAWSHDKVKMVQNLSK